MLFILRFIFATAKSMNARRRKPCSKSFVFDINDNVAIDAYRGSQQLTLTMKMTTEQVVETSATVNNITFTVILASITRTSH